MAITTTDDYLNNPSTGYNKNSFQFILGATYTDIERIKNRKWQFCSRIRSLSYGFHP